ncbi:FixH family protein [Bacillus sp. REN10]|uniref:FixH family protein n=1 Tax=Bacillus sp. REN10 TaxID=2782541 RepID=UPI00193B4FDA|nr:FixH family protein [Bacillus sp. REN10]
MKRMVVLLSAMLLVATGCSKEEKKVEENKSETVVPLEVKIQLPETVNAHEKVSIEAVVTQGKEQVEDADKVEFEVWKGDAKDHEMIAAKHQGDGVYAIEQAFAEEGNYSVIAHVTGRDLHNMPKKEFVVGAQKTAPKAEETAKNTEEHQHGHHHGNVAIDFHPGDQWKANEEITLTTHIKNEGEPLHEARVRFEIWQKGSAKHTFVDATEGENGQYNAQTTFEAAGDYNVKVHVEKGELHEHIEVVVPVTPR